MAPNSGSVPTVITVTVSPCTGSRALARRGWLRLPELASTSSLPTREDNKAVTV